MTSVKISVSRESTLDTNDDETENTYAQNNNKKTFWISQQGIEPKVQPLRHTGRTVRNFETLFFPPNLYSKISRRAEPLRSELQESSWCAGTIGEEGLLVRKVGRENTG